MQKEGHWILWVPSSTGLHSLLPFHQKNFRTWNLLKTRRRTDENGRPLVHGVRALRLLGKKAKEREQLLPFSGFVFQISERITEVLERVPAGITPNVSNYYSEHSLTIKKICYAEQSLVDINQKHIFSQMNRGKSPSSGTFVPLDSFLWENQLL